VSSEVFAHWVSDARYRDRHGEPRVLRRQGRAPSLQSLARLVTRDVHLRSLLDELLRLKLGVGLYTFDADTAHPPAAATPPRKTRKRL